MRLVVKTSDASVVQRLEYDAWGVTTDVTGTGLTPGFQPFGFAGGLYDRQTKFVRFGARDYDPSIGRWVSKDESRLRGGLNFYAYANNDPVNFVDLTGHTPTGASWGQAIGSAIGAMIGFDIGAGVGAVEGGLVTAPTGPGAVGGVVGGTAVGGVAGGIAGAAAGGAIGRVIGDAVSNVCSSGDDDDDCKRKATEWELEKAGIDAHEEKKVVAGSGNVSRFDICKCDSGGFAIKKRGCLGPIIERL